MLQVLRYGRGHMAVDCKLVNLKKLQKFGFGIPGQGFYSLNIPEARAKEAATTGLLTILEGEASEERVDKELKHLVRSDWDFKVRKMDQQEYLTVFPDKNMLDTFIMLTGFEMSLFGLKGCIFKSFMEKVYSSGHIIPVCGSNPDYRSSSFGWSHQPGLKV